MKGWLAVLSLPFFIVAHYIMGMYGMPFGARLVVGMAVFFGSAFIIIAAVEDR